MDDIRIVELKESVLEDNNADAEKLRQELKSKGICLLNLMSSPGSGKTSTLLALNRVFNGRLRWGVMEADIDSDVDARTIRAAGLPSVQLHTGGMCHLDADMTRQGIAALGEEELELIVLENIGNLVCPAEFDTGAHHNITILSVPEGDDKPLKYPLMYTVSDVVLINKIDTLPYFDFDIEKAKERILKLNPKAVFFPISAKTGEGTDAFCEWILGEVDAVKAGMTR